MGSLALKARLGPLAFLFMLPVTFPPIVLSSEQLDEGLSVSDSCEEDEETDPVLGGRAFPSPGIAVLATGKESFTFPLGKEMPSDEIAVPLILVIPFMML